MGSVAIVIAFSLLSLVSSVSSGDTGTALGYETGVREERFSPTCTGIWSKWSQCNKDCYKERVFDLTPPEDKDCPEFAPRQREIEYALCNDDPCPIEPAMKSTLPHGDYYLRDALVRSGVPSMTVRGFANVFADSRLVVNYLLFTAICVGGMFASFKIAWLPDMCVIIPAAALIAWRLRAISGTSFGPAGNAIFCTVIERLMNDLLIPVSIFEAAYHMQVQNFYAVFKTGMLFAVVGTGLSTIMIAAMVQKTGVWGWHPVSGWREAVAYAAFIADVDPVATLSIFSSLEVDALLATLVGGEATLNDPIALVIFGVCNQPTRDITFDLPHLPQHGRFCVWLLASSIIMGLAVGLLFTFVFKLMRLSGQGYYEPCYIVICAYLSYNIGEGFGLSGIIVTLFCGLAMGIYTNQLVSDKAVVDAFVSTAARLADSCMFVIIGFCCFLVDDMQGITLGFLTILFCLIARAIMIAILVPFTNICWVLFGAGSPGIDMRRAFMMWHSGLRGGMTVMMALMVDPYWSKNQNVLLNATIVVVLGHAYLCGCTGPFFLKLLDIPTGVPQEDGTIEMAPPRGRQFLERAHEALLKLLNLPASSEKQEKIHIGVRRSFVRNSTVGSFRSTQSQRDSQVLPIIVELGSIPNQDLLSQRLSTST